MSIIIAYRKGDRFYLGADTRSSAGSTISTAVAPFDQKIHAFENGLLVGLTGSARLAKKILVQEELFKLPPEGLTAEDIATRLAPKLCELYTKEDDSCGMILARKDRCILIRDNLDILEISDFAAIGCGKYYAFPYLYRAAPDCDANALLLEAMRCAAKYDSSVGAPFVLVNTKDLQFCFREE